MLGGSGEDPGGSDLNPHRDALVNAGRTAIVAGVRVYGTPVSGSMKRPSPLVATQTTKATKLESESTRVPAQYEVPTLQELAGNAVEELQLPTQPLSLIQDAIPPQLGRRALWNNHAPWEAPPHQFTWEAFLDGGYFQDTIDNMRAAPRGRYQVHVDTRNYDVLGWGYLQ